ncbi:unnamed protein product [Trichobilharzia regenti]|nr:unnamed protein product [Trichobilharzia regenti]
MNRGRRRGGGPSLSGLRDGVKRRLFDPHSVPTKPDPKFEVSRLIPFTFPKVVIHSSLSGCSADDNSDVGKTDRDGLQINLVCVNQLYCPAVYLFSHYIQTNCNYIHFCSYITNMPTEVYFFTRYLFVD